MLTLSVATRVSLQNILLTTDFLPCAEATLPYALGLARRYGSTLHVVNVLPHVVFVEAETPDPVEIRRMAEKKMADLARSEAFKGIKHQELLEEGEVAEVLCNLVRKYHIDLIVMGTCGRKGVDKLLLGSVAELVYRTAECAVLTLGPHVVRGLKIDGELRHILFATDFGPESLHGLPYALSLAEEHKARLTLLHVAPEPSPLLPEPEPGSLPVLSPEQVVGFTERQLRDLVPAGAKLWHEPEYMVQFGTPAETVLKIAEQNVDLIVLGVRRPAALTPHMGMGVAYRIVCEAPCPVLSVGAKYHG